jgi:hypothetical protein
MGNGFRSKKGSVLKCGLTVANRGNWHWAMGIRHWALGWCLRRRQMSHERGQTI